MAQYIRADKRDDKSYYWLVESHREGKKVIQKRLKYLGTEKPTLVAAIRQYGRHYPLEISKKHKEEEMAKEKVEVKTENKLEALADAAMSQLFKFFKGEEHTGRDIAVARVSTAVISSWTRYQQTKSAETATLFMMARELATDKEQLARYISVTMPDVGILKLLPTPGSN